jgi:glycosyltransferase involved in cell wall biosynthesis
MTLIMKIKTAIIHDWLNGMRGGEKVLEQILDIFPDADIFTLFLEEKNISEKIRSHKIIASSLNKYKLVRKYYKLFLPLLPATIEEFNLNQYELVISISHCVAKGIIPHPNARHISYVNSPMRYIWDQYYSYFGDSKGLKKSIIKYQTSRLRMWDVASSSRVDHFIGNSSFIRERIQRFYRREADVIHPPVDTDFFVPSSNPKKDYFLTVSALVPYKGNDLLVEAFNRTGDKLIIVGKGPEENRLKKMANSNIGFRKDLSPEDLKTLYQNASAYVFAGIEDFGITFVEAQACGTPVIAYNKGGILDIVNDDRTGVLFNSQRVEDIINRIQDFKRMTFDISFIRENSLKFSNHTFNIKFREFIEKKL